MPCISYKTVKLSAGRRVVVDQANKIISEYSAQGFDLTLRQLYYQFVSRDFIRNDQKEYKRLGEIINDARLSGLLDWHHISDRTRNLRGLSHWDSPADIIQSAAYSFRVDKWATQPRRVEVWVEKDALVGVIEPVCVELDVPYFSCRGYTSQSEMWSASQRILAHFNAGQQETLILHLGDHDPSGIDMSRDILDRLELFTGGRFNRSCFRRLALNANQVEEYNPPPNPAKITDSRFEAYQAKHGGESWELDALNPTTIAELIRTAVKSVRSATRWKEAVSRETRMRADLKAAAGRWPDVAAYLAKGSDQ